METRKIVLPAAAAFGTAAAIVPRLPVFGRNPNRAKRKSYQKRTQYFDGNRFVYPKEWITQEPEENRIVSKHQTHPAQPLPAAKTNFSGSDQEVLLTWFGHSSYMLQLKGKTILVDPVFSKRCSPFQWAGPKRFTVPTIRMRDISHIDIVLLTHDHHDHLDPLTLKALEPRTDRFIVPLGVECHLKRWGIPSRKITRMAWWEHTDTAEFMISCLPAYHFSGRRFIDRDRTLWCAWMLKTDDKQYYLSGDGGFGKHYQLIREKYGPVDFAVMECGMYNQKWHDIHMYPEESVKAAKILGAKFAMPIHWGSFVISNHPWDDPPERFVRAADEAGICSLTPLLCETMNLSKPAQYQKRWWRDYK